MLASPSIHAPSPLTPDDLSLLEALARPGADLAALASSRGLSLTDLARWLRLPPVKDAFDSLRELFDLQRRLWQEQHVRDAIETLNEVMKVSDSPVERRRAASAILRAFTATLLPRRDPTSGSRSANGARSASECPPPTRPARPVKLTYTPIDDPFPSYPPTHPPTPPASPPQASSPTPQAPPSSPPSSISSPPQAPSPKPQAPLSSPDSTADCAIALLREANPPDVRSAVLALDSLLDEFAPRTPDEARAILEGLGDFITAIPGAAVSSEPATLLDPRLAVKVYTVTRADRPPRRFAVTLARSDTGAWCFQAVTPHDTG